MDAAPLHSSACLVRAGGNAELVNAAGYPVATMVNAKGMVDEQHPCYIGTYALGAVQGHPATSAC